MGQHYEEFIENGTRQVEIINDRVDSEYQGRIMGFSAGLFEACERAEKLGIRPWDDILLMTEAEIRELEEIPEWDEVEVE